MRLLFWGVGSYFTSCNPEISLPCKHFQFSFFFLACWPLFGCVKVETSSAIKHKMLQVHGKSQENVCYAGFPRPALQPSDEDSCKSVLPYLWLLSNGHLKLAIENSF